MRLLEAIERLPSDLWRWKAAVKKARLITGCGRGFDALALERPLRRHAQPDRFVVSAARGRLCTVMGECGEAYGCFGRKTEESIQTLYFYNAVW